MNNVTTSSLLRGDPNQLCLKDLGNPLVSMPIPKHYEDNGLWIGLAASNSLYNAGGLKIQDYEWDIDGHFALLYAWCVLFGLSVMSRWSMQDAWMRGKKAIATFVCSSWQG